MTRTQCRDQTKCLRCLRGELEVQKISCRINEPSILGLRFPPMACENERNFPDIHQVGRLTSPSLGSPRPIDTFGQCRIAAGKHCSDITAKYFVLPKTTKTETKRAAFCWSLLIQAQAFLIYISNAQKGKESPPLGFSVEIGRDTR